MFGRLKELEEEVQRKYMLTNELINHVEKGMYEKIKRLTWMVENPSKFKVGDRVSAPATKGYEGYGDSDILITGVSAGQDHEWNYTWFYDCLYEKEKNSFRTIEKRLVSFQNGDRSYKSLTN